METQGRFAQTLAERTTRELRDAILRLRLRPGARLVEREIAEQAGVSRTSVRAALQQLASEGLVERRARGVLTVAAVSDSEAREIYEVRAALEPAMARLFVARADAADLRALASAAERVAAPGAAPEDYVTALGAFYEILLRGSGNETARRFLRQLEARVSYLRRLTTERAAPERRQQTMKLVLGIHAAAAARDADLIARRCEAFVTRSAKFALRVLREAQG